MAERWENSSPDRWRHRNERGFGERAADEVRSWFGDDDAERRRDIDAAREGRPYGERGFAGEPGRYRDYPQDRAIGREDYRDYRQAGETALGRPDWGFGREGSYADRARMYRTEPSWGRESTPVGRAYPSSSSGTSGWTQPEYRGSFAGMGPKGYRRSDQRTLEDVCDRLTDDPRVNASDIEVRCSDGTVTLTGTVQSRDEKRWAEDIAESVTGVRDVNNSLRVTTGGIGTPGSPQTPLGLSSPGGESRSVTNVETEPTKRR